MSRGLKIAAWCAVVKDGELKTSAAGNNYATVLLATDSGKADAQGRPEQVFRRTIAFGELAAAAAGLRKGQRAYVEGQLKPGLYTPEGGEPRLDLSVIAFKLEPTRIGRSRPRPERQERRAEQHSDPQTPLDPPEANLDGTFDPEVGDRLDF